MPQINCYIPIKLRITGRPTDQQLDQLAETLVRTLTARIAFAERTINSGQPVSESRLVTPVAFPTAVSSESARRPSVAPRSAGPLRVKGPDTDENVYRFLRALTRRLSRFRNVKLARIMGDELEYEGQRYRLRPRRFLEEGLTVSSFLGEGVFFLQPFVSLFGPGYEIYQVDSQGSLDRMDTQVDVEGLDSIPEGILIYSARQGFLAGGLVEARRPRDTAALAQRMIAILSVHAALLNPARTVSAVLSVLERADVTHEEMMDILQRLKRVGRIGEFLNLIQVRQFREFLKQKDVPWTYIRANWEPSINDSLLVWGGFMVGAAENVVEAIRFFAMIIGFEFSEELAKDRERFLAAIEQFWKDPLVSTLRRGIEHFFATYDEQLQNLEFFEAGRTLGKAVVFMLTLPSAVRALPKAAGALGGAAIKLVRLTIRQLQAMGATLDEIGALASGLRPALQLAGGGQAVVVGENIAVLDKLGQQIGLLSKSEVLSAMMVAGQAAAGGEAPGARVEGEELPPVAEAARETFQKFYKDLEKAGWKPEGPHNAIRPDPSRYATVEIRPNGDVFGSHKDLTKYLNETGLSGRRTKIGSTIESHHLLEDDWMKRFGIARDEGRAIALESTDHAHFSAEVPKHLQRKRLFDIDDIFEAHAKVYRDAGHPEWIEEMREFLRQKRDVIKGHYEQGLVRGAKQPGYAARLKRVLSFLDSL